MAIRYAIGTAIEFGHKFSGHFEPWSVLAVNVQTLHKLLVGSLFDVAGLLYSPFEETVKLSDSVTHFTKRPTLVIVKCIDCVLKGSLENAVRQNVALSDIELEAPTFRPCDGTLTFIGSINEIPVGIPLSIREVALVGFDKDITYLNIQSQRAYSELSGSFPVPLLLDASIETSELGFTLLALEERNVLLRELYARRRCVRANCVGLSLFANGLDVPTSLARALALEGFTSDVKLHSAAVDLNLTPIRRQFTTCLQYASNHCNCVGNL